MTIDIARLVPRFILRDRSGYAMAKALEAGLSAFDQVISDGLDCLMKISAMPEWRLDEMAWEYGCLYDEAAPVEVKRQWIENAVPMNAILGTKEGVIQYLKPFFDDVEIQEDGNYVFHVSLFGELTPELEAWATKAIETAKNVRSVLGDALNVSASSDIDLTDTETEWYAYERPMAGTFLSGTDAI